jgi:hypothetical protein
MISQIKSPVSLFFCSCAVLLAGQQPLSDWYTAITTSIIALVALGTVYLGRRVREDEARGEQDGKTSRLSVFSGFVGKEQELVVSRPVLFCGETDGLVLITVNNIEDRACDIDLLALISIVSSPCADLVRHWTPCPDQFMLYAFLDGF